MVRPLPDEKHVIPDDKHSLGWPRRENWAQYLIIAPEPISKKYKMKILQW